MLGAPTQPRYSLRSDNLALAHGPANTERTQAHCHSVEGCRAQDLPVKSQNRWRLGEHVPQHDYQSAQTRQQ
jgi:hypothetical protein